MNNPGLAISWPQPRLLRLLPCLALTWTLLACAQTDAPRPGPEASIAPLEDTITFPPNGLANFVSEAGQFEIFFPVPPEQKEVERRGAKGETFSAVHDEKAYFAGYMIHSYDGMEKVILHRSLRKVARKHHCRITGERDIHFRGYPGREATMICKGDSALLKARHYCVDSFVYMLNYSASEDHYSEAEAKAFLDSFDRIFEPTELRTAFRK